MSQTSAALVEASLSRAALLEPWLRAFAWLDPERARRLAAAADARRARGELLGPLHGAPVGVKDIIDTAGIPTEHGSALFAGRVPTRSAIVVERLEAAGAIVLGKTVTAELAFYQPGPTVNPYDRARTPGGSSMGSAAAVAADIVPLAVGTQTNGSVIRPAAFCGVVGFKPSVGRIPRDGILTFSATLDQVGVFARSVEGAARLAAVLAGDPIEAWWTADLSRRPRLAVARTIDFELAEPAARRQFEADVAALRSAGAVIEEPALPGGLEQALPVLRTIMYVEGAANLGPQVRVRPDLVSAVMRALVDEGTATPRETYAEALRERQRLVEAFGEWAPAYDGVLALPAAGEAPAKDTTGDPRFCTRWTLVGAPALTLPTGLGPSRLPLGLQLVGPIGGDARLLAVAAWASRVLPAPAGPPLPT